jgi:hypothetical protein
MPDKLRDVLLAAVDGDPDARNDFLLTFARTGSPGRGDEAEEALSMACEALLRVWGEPASTPFALNQRPLPWGRLDLDAPANALPVALKRWISNMPARDRELRPRGSGVGNEVTHDPRPDGVIELGRATARDKAGRRPTPPSFTRETNPTAGELDGRIDAAPLAEPNAALEIGALLAVLNQPSRGSQPTEALLRLMSPWLALIPKPEKTLSKQLRQAARARKAGMRLHDRDACDAAVRGLLNDVAAMDLREQQSRFTRLLAAAQRGRATPRDLLPELKGLSASGRAFVLAHDVISGYSEGVEASGPDVGADWNGVTTTTPIEPDAATQWVNDNRDYQVLLNVILMRFDPTIR